MKNNQVGFDIHFPGRYIFRASDIKSRWELSVQRRRGNTLTTTMREWYSPKDTKRVRSKSAKTALDALYIASEYLDDPSIVPIEPDDSYRGFLSACEKVCSVFTAHMKDAGDKRNDPDVFFQLWARTPRSRINVTAHERTEGWCTEIKPEGDKHEVETSYHPGYSYGHVRDVIKAETELKALSCAVTSLTHPEKRTDILGKHLSPDTKLWLKTFADSISMYRKELWGDAPQTSNES